MSTLLEDLRSALALLHQQPPFGTLVLYSEANRIISRPPVGDDAARRATPRVAQYDDVDSYIEAAMGGVVQEEVIAIVG